MTPEKDEKFPVVNKRRLQKTKIKQSRTGLNFNIPGIVYAGNIFYTFPFLSKTIFPDTIPEIKYNPNISKN